MRGVIEKLGQLRAMDPGFEVFGAYQHQYRLGPPLGAGELARFEERYRVALPADLRRFLTEVGNGGAGPGYGLERVGLEGPPRRVEPETRIVFSGGRRTLPIESYRECFDGLYFATIEELRSRPDLLSMPSPLTEALEGLEEPSAEEWEALCQGALSLADYGCGIMARLVVTGPRAGEVWVFDDCDWQGVTPYSDFAELLATEIEPRPYSFGEWYEHWLDDAIAGIGATVADSAGT